MAKVTKSLTSLTDTQNIASDITRSLEPGMVVLLSGPLGSGKTTLVQHILSQLGVAEPVVSPTFVIMRHYQGREFDVHHLDLYRLKSLDELMGIGIDEITYQPGSLAFIEWPELVSGLLDPSKVIKLELELMDGNTRQITITTYGDETIH